MQVVNVADLKTNASEALRQTREVPVVVGNRDQPVTERIVLQSGNLLPEPGARVALASFIADPSSQGTSVVDHEVSEVVRDMHTLDGWLASSCTMPSR